MGDAGAAVNGIGNRFYGGSRYHILGREKMKKKRLLAGVLSAVMAMSVAVFNPTVVKAEGWLDNVQEIEMGVSYSDNFTYDDYSYYSNSDFKDYLCDSYKIDVPEDGSISFAMESADERYSSGFYSIKVDIYKIDDPDNALYHDTLKFSLSTSRGCYYVDGLKYGLNKGTYYIVLSFGMGVHQVTSEPTESYTITVDYNASVATTRFKSCEKTKKGLSLNWNRVSGIDGYQIEYSTKEDFSAKKKTITIKDVKTVKQLINGIKKKKTYYVRIRSYKYVKVNGVKEQFFSDWSETSSL